MSAPEEKKKLSAPKRHYGADPIVAVGAIAPLLLPPPTGILSLGEGRHFHGSDVGVILFFRLERIAALLI